MRKPKVCWSSSICRLMRRDCRGSFPVASSSAWLSPGQDEAMALADIVVLMNGGRIEQQGSPREIFNHPRTEFAAKFIGGHNVIALGDETFAVRNDRLMLKKAGEAVNGPSIAGTVSEVEYQGTYVRVAIAADGGAGKPTEDPQFCNRPVA